jgi:hypothetical protein
MRKILNKILNKAHVVYSIVGGKPYDAASEYGIMREYGANIQTYSKDEKDENSVN